MPTLVRLRGAPVARAKKGARDRRMGSGSAVAPQNKPRQVAGASFRRIGLAYWRKT